MSQKVQLTVPKVIANRFIIDHSKQIGKGSFGWVFKVVDSVTNEILAAKIEPRRKHCLLYQEYRILRIMEGEAGFSTVRYFGEETNVVILIMDCLGRNVEDEFNRMNRIFSLPTIAKYGILAVNLLERLHEHNYIHCDIKPENFLFGTGAHSNDLYLIDFGLSKLYRDEYTHAHIPFATHHALTGTPRYATIGAHCGLELSRKDDLESVGYILLYLLKGSLPWQGIHCPDPKTKYRLIGEMKLATPVELLCNGCPVELASFLSYARSIPFTARPNYDYLRTVLLHMVSSVYIIHKKIPVATIAQEEESVFEEEAAAPSQPSLTIVKCVAADWAITAEEELSRHVFEWIPRKNKLPPQSQTPPTSLPLQPSPHYAGGEQAQAADQAPHRNPSPAMPPTGGPPRHGSGLTLPHITHTTTPTPTQQKTPPPEPPPPFSPEQEQETKKPEEKPKEEDQKQTAVPKHPIPRKGIVSMISAHQNSFTSATPTETELTKRAMLTTIITPPPPIKETQEKHPAKVLPAASQPLHTKASHSKHTKEAKKEEEESDSSTYSPFISITHATDSIEHITTVVAVHRASGDLGQHFHTREIPVPEMNAEGRIRPQPPPPPSVQSAPLLDLESFSSVSIDTKSVLSLDGYLARHGDEIQRDPQLTHQLQATQEQTSQRCRKVKEPQDDDSLLDAGFVFVNADQLQGSLSSIVALEREYMEVMISDIVPGTSPAKDEPTSSKDGHNIVYIYRNPSQTPASSELPSSSVVSTPSSSQPKKDSTELTPSDEIQPDN